VIIGDLQRSFNAGVGLIESEERQVKERQKRRG
jgi:hypothetical protein